MARLSVFSVGVTIFSVASTVSAQWWDSGNGNDDSHGPPWGNGPPPWANGNPWNGGSGSSSTPGSPSSAFSNAGAGVGYRIFGLSMSGVVVAHAVLAGLAWLVLYPLGGILMRTVRSRFTARIHAMVQVFATLVFAAAVAMGIWIANQWTVFGIDAWKDPHLGLGIFLFVLVCLQPISGVIHHIRFKRAVTAATQQGTKTLPQRSGVSYWHLWMGRILLLLGIVNGGLGLRLAGRTPMQAASTTKNAKIAYGVIAAVVGLIYIAVVARSEMRRAAANQEANTLENPRSIELRGGGGDGSESGFESANGHGIGSLGADEYQVTKEYEDPPPQYRAPPRYE